MLNQEKSRCILIFVVLSIIFSISVFKLILDYNKIQSRLTGNSIQSDLREFYDSIPIGSKILLLVLWLLLLSVIIYINLRDKIILEKKRREGNIHIDLEKTSKTDLDSLFNVIRDKRELPISVISHTFNIDENLAIEWVKMLETSNLVSLDYPRFGPPKVKLIEKENL